MRTTKRRGGGEDGTEDATVFDSCKFALYTSDISKYVFSS